jgi:hypothetical protein
MLFYDKIFEKSGIDCWRLFECSWLDPKGRPQLAIFEIALENSSIAINTFELKKIISSIAQLTFERSEDVQLYFQEVLKNSSVLLSIKELNHQIAALHPLYHHPGTYYFRRTVHFICSVSKKPFYGELHIVFASPLLDPLDLDRFLMINRSKEFMQSDYIDDLKRKIQSLRIGYALSLHLARRGGISYQAIRWSEYPFLEPKSLLTISSME